jgi:hypothetical protein
MVLHYCLPPSLIVLLLSLLTTTLLPGGVVEAIPFFKKKHRRQKAGTRYEQHDPVHIVVNKVGWVVSSSSVIVSNAHTHTHTHTHTRIIFMWLGIGFVVWPSSPPYHVEHKCCLFDDEHYFCEIIISVRKREDLNKPFLVFWGVGRDGA